MEKKSGIAIVHVFKFMHASLDVNALNKKNKEQYINMGIIGNDMRIK